MFHSAPKLSLFSLFDESIDKLLTENVRGSEPSSERCGGEHKNGCFILCRGESDENV